MLTKERLAAIPHESGVGADIEGFDFATLDAVAVAELKAHWLRYGLLRFRRTGIDDVQHIAFSRLFGDFVIHPKQYQEGGHPTHPEILVLSNVKKDGKPIGALGNSEATWHTDTWFYEKPPAAAILRAVQLPPAGGDTYFLSTYQAYDTLPEALRKAVDGRQIFFQNVYDKRGELRLGRAEPKSRDFREWSGVVHPLVRRHGESGRRALYLGGTPEGSWIVGMPLDESEDLLAELWAHTTGTAEVFAQQWQPGDIMMWDNRCTMHRRDSFDPETIRIMHRTTTAGERPV